MKEYKLITGTNQQLFEAQINLMFSQGFKLYGELIITTKTEADGSTVSIFNQSMVKDK